MTFLPAMNRDEMQRMLEEERVGRIGLNDERQPYVVPTDFAYMDGAIYIHTPSNGRKARLARDDPHVCFEVDRYNEAVTDFRSILVRGEIREVSDSAERRSAMDILKEKAVKSGDLTEYTVSPDSFSRILVLRIDISEMSGIRSPLNGEGHHKARVPPH